MPAPDRNALLKSIEKGKRLNKTVTNDRSAPLIGNVVNTAATPNGNVNNVRDGESASGGGMGMGIGGLFAGGMPKLRSTGSKLLSDDVNKGSVDNLRRNETPVVDPPSVKRQQSVPSVSVNKPSLPSASSNTPQQPPKLRTMSTAPPSNIVKPSLPSRNPPPPPISSTFSTGNVPKFPSLRPVEPREKLSTPTPTSAAPRPSLPTRPNDHITPAIKKLNIDDRISADRTKSTSAVEGNRFPNESQIPKPGKHSGKTFVYPSGREKGCYINEPMDDSAVVTPRNIINNRQAPQSLPVMKPERAVPAPIVDLTPKIQSKLKAVERELSDAIDAQEFEKCVQLKPRIMRLKELLQRSQSGDTVSQKELDSV